MLFNKLLKTIRNNIHIIGMYKDKYFKTIDVDRTTSKKRLSSENTLVIYLRVSSGYSLIAV